MSETQTFTAQLEAVGKTTAKIIIPFDVKKVFGAPKPPITGTINDHPYRTTPALYDGVYLMVVNHEMRAGAKAEAGDTVTVTMMVDEEPRVVEVPEDLTAALKKRPAAAAVFDALSFSHKSEYVAWITEAKKDDARARRVGKAIEMLQVHVKTPR